MKKFLFLSLLVSTVNVFALPTSSSKMIQAVLSSEEFIQKLEEVGQYKSLHMEGISKKELTEKAKTDCSQQVMSKSGGFLEVTLERFDQDSIYFIYGFGGGTGFKLCDQSI